MYGALNKNTLSTKLWLNSDDELKMFKMPRELKLSQCNYS